MRYFWFTVYTPFVGEDKDVFIAAEDYEAAKAKAADAAGENGMEWCDEQSLEDYDMTEEDYYEQCGYDLKKEISDMQYNEMIMEGEWCI